MARGGRRLNLLLGCDIGDLLAIERNDGKAADHK